MYGTGAKIEPTDGEIEHTERQQTKLKQLKNPIIRRAEIKQEAESTDSTDRGWSVVVLIASFTIHFIIDGVCLSYGIFYLELIDCFEDSKSKILTVGSVIMGAYMLVAPCIGGLTNLFGCRMVTISGSIIAAVFIGISSIAPSVDILLITYGLFGGIGFGMMYLPSIIMVSFYFTRRRAFATGVTVCGTGVGMFVFSPVTEILMDTYGWRGANWILAGFILNGVACGMVYRPLQSTPSTPRLFQKKKKTTVQAKTVICDATHCRHDNDVDDETGQHVKNKTSISRPDIFYSGSIINVTKSMSLDGRQTSCPCKCPCKSSCSSGAMRRCQPFWFMLRQMIDVSPFRSLVFNVLNVGTVIPFLGIYVPFSCIAHHAELRLHCTSAEGAILMLVLGVTNTIGRIVSGYLSDSPRIDCVLFHNITLLIAGIITCLLPLFDSYGLMVFYLIVYGPTIAVFITLKSIVIVDLLGLENMTSSFGLTALFDGIATICGNPISGALLDRYGSYTESFILVGLFLIAGSLICFPLRTIKHWTERHRRTNNEPVVE